MELRIGVVGHTIMQSKIRCVLVVSFVCDDSACHHAWIAGTNPSGIRRMLRWMTPQSLISLATARSPSTEIVMNKK